MRFRSIALAGLLLAGLPALQSSAAAEPRWTSAAELEDPAVAADIEAFWGQHRADVSFTGRGGLKIHALQFRQDELAGERGAIIIVSGRTEASVKYKELVRDLWRMGYSVYLHDHRGQGQSDREADTAATPEKGHVDRFDDYVADLQQFIKGQVLPVGHRRHYLLAHSMGGAIAARYLESNGTELKRINAAVLSSPMLQIDGMIPDLPADLLSCKLAKSYVKVGLATQYRWFGGGYKPADFGKNEYTHSEIRYQRLLEQYARTPEVRLGDQSWGWIANACEGARLAREQAAKLRTPVLVMVAGADKIVHNAGAQEFCLNLAKAGGGRRCEPVNGQAPLVVKGSRHEMLIEDDAYRMLALNTAATFFAAH